MNEYNISDYNLFSNASSTTKNLINSIESNDNEVLSIKSTISNESIFKGPAADKCKTSIDGISTNNKEMISNFNTLSNYFTTVSDNYKAGDNEVLNAIMTLTSSTATTISDYEQLAAMQTGGKIVKDTFKASNGVKMEYYLYTPSFSNGQTDGLPLTLYLHGDSGYGDYGVLGSSLPKLLNKGLNVPGYVLMPKSTNNKNGWWNDSKGAKKNRDAAVELTKKVAEENNCDMTRISACGHSNGGCGVHHLVAENTDLFSAYVSSAGATGTSEKFNNIGNAKVYSWGFHGTKDTNVAYSNSNGVGGKETYERLEANFPEGTQFTTLEGRDHYIQDDLWTTEFDYNGTKMTPIEWLFTTKKYGT